MRHIISVQDLVVDLKVVMRHISKILNPFQVLLQHSFFRCKTICRMATFSLQDLGLLLNLTPTKILETAKPFSVLIRSRCLEKKYSVKRYVTCSPSHPNFQVYY